MSLESTAVASLHRLFHTARPDQPLWSISMLAIRASTGVAYYHGAMLVPGDDESEAKGIGIAFLEGQYPSTQGWTHSVATSRITINDSY